MTRLATTPAVFGILAGGMLAAGLAAGCGSNQVAIGSQNMDAQAPGADAAAGRGGAVAGSGGGSATGGTVGVGGATPSGGTIASGGSKAGGGTIGTGAATGTGGGSGGTTTTCALVGESCATSSCCGPLICRNLTGSSTCFESIPPPADSGTGQGGTGGAGGGTGGTSGAPKTGGAGGSTGKTCGGLAGASCATGEFCDLLAGSCNVSDATGTCVVKKKTGDCPVFDVAPPPVCGCDGKPYYDDCERQVAGVFKKSDGVCPTADAGVIMTPTLPAACQVDGDCCVAVDSCTAVAYLVGRTEYPTMVASIPGISSGVETCVHCISPAVQVRCNGGFCAGEKLPSSSSTTSLTSSHCGYISVSDAGASTGSAHAAVDAGTAAGPSTWGCGP